MHKFLEINLPLFLKLTVESEPKVSSPVDQTVSDLDMQIALRKGTQSCTQYPIANFLSYTKLSPAFRALTKKVFAVEVLKNIQEAQNHPEWRKAIEEEMYALRKNGTWEIVDLPDGKSPVRCKWVFNIKYRSDGNIERYKARLAAKGFSQTLGVDYLETFALVAKLNTIMILL